MLTESLIREHTNLNKGILIGYSGGPDSTALVHLLSSLRAYQELDVKAIHINHNLSKHSAMWENHCIETCSKLNINFSVDELLKLFEKNLKLLKITEPLIKKWNINYNKNLMDFSIENR